ncbi:WHG domain-containing protein [Granulicella arctica]|uniref:WHG domain-containing protein n=1 Tax=Granulicella arctica TaxID=940613 RepID=UPI0021DF6563|nr:TetR-like C-terminal domain-containing protein [Granulicella arctica]
MGPSQPATKAQEGAASVSEYGRDYANRYQLLFSDPAIAEQEGDLQEAAMASLSAFALLVAECQQAAILPVVPNSALASLLYASVYGLIDLQATGGMKTEKGFMNVSDGIALLLKVLATEIDPLRHVNQVS